MFDRHSHEIQIFVSHAIGGGIARKCRDPGEIVTHLKEHYDIMGTMEIPSIDGQTKMPILSCGRALDCGHCSAIDRYSYTSPIRHIEWAPLEEDNIDNIITIIIWSECFIFDTHTHTHTRSPHSCAYHFSCICSIMRAYPLSRRVWADNRQKPDILLYEYVFNTCFIELHSNSYQKANVVWKRYHQRKFVCIVWPGSCSPLDLLSASRPQCPWKVATNISFPIWCKCSQWLAFCLVRVFFGGRLCPALSPPHPPH